MNTTYRTRTIGSHTLIYAGPPRIDEWDGSWHRTITLDGCRYRASVVSDGRPRRLAYGNRRGYHWTAVLRNQEGNTVYIGDCNKSTGVVGILVRAGLLEDETASKGD